MQIRAFDDFESVCLSINIISLLLCRRIRASVFLQKKKIIYANKFFISGNFFCFTNFINC